MKTTRILLLALIPALMFGSCVKEVGVDKNGIETVKNEDTGELPVNIMVADSGYAETRVETTLGTLNNKTVKLYAYQKNGTNYVVSDPYPMKSGITATISGSSMLLGSTYYWPVSNGLDFYAVYPEAWAASADQAGGSPYTPTITTGTHEVKSAMSDQVDVLYAYAAGANGSTVAITFQHALTKVTFQGTITNNVPVKITDAKITAITVKSVYNNGTFSFSGTSATWTSFGVKKDLDAISGFEHEIPSANGTYIGNGSFFLIPNVSGVSVDVTVKWEGAVARTYTVSLPATPAWEVGKWVNYMLQLDATKGVLAVGPVTVKPWGTSGNPDVTGQVTIN